MDEDTCVSFWEFEINCSGKANLLCSNSAIVNFLCAAVVSHDDQLVVKIYTDSLKNAKIVVLTKGNEAKQLLLINYSTEKIFKELKTIIDSFSDISVVSINLIKLGFVLDFSFQDFDDLKLNVENTLQSMDSFTLQNQLCLGNSSAVLNDDRIISEWVTPSVLQELFRNNSLPFSEPSPSPQTSHATTSSASHSSGTGPFSVINASPRSASSDFSWLLQSVAPSIDGLFSGKGRAQNCSPSSNLFDKAVVIEELTLRDYQLELAKPGLEGKNCIIVAPTGSGKTIVAAHICKTLIAKKSSPRILFLVPRVPLVAQQFKVFQKYLGEVVFQVSGDKSSSVPTETSIGKHVMTVMTAQILLNLLRDALIKFESIDLIIFDECHHAMKKHVYNQIMQLYLDKHLSRSNSELPQIVGLSASLGVGKAKTVENAEKNIKTLMANLNVTIAPVQVQEHIASLNLHQNKAGDEVVLVNRDPDNVFANKLVKAMRDSEALLPLRFEQFYNVVNDGQLHHKPVGTRGKQDYEEWVVHLLDDSILIQHALASQWFMGIARHLRKYNDALIMNDHVRSSDVKEYLENFLEDQPSNETNRALREIYDEHEPQPTIGTNPLLEKLKEVLTQQYQDKPLSRCIIFVRTRPIAKVLINYLGEQSRLLPFSLNAKFLTGTNAKTEHFGMTKADQEGALLAFRCGSCKVLVSTSVAEEGLDIKQCNLIVTYNYATNEIGKVQRKGRGRAEDSRFIILAYRDSGIAEREDVNTIRVQLANKVLEKIRETSPNVLKSEIVSMQVQAKKFRDAALIEQQLAARMSNVYKLLCVGCKTEMTSSERIRQINNQHHVVIDPDFRERMNIRRLRPPKEVAQDVVLTGYIWCKNMKCTEKWGSCMNYKGLPIYVLGVKGFVLCEESGIRSTVKQWNQVPFYHSIPELDQSSLSYIFDSEESESDDDFDFDI